MEREKLVSLVTAARSGNERALNDLFNAFYNDVYYFALKLTRDDLIACDVTQETFVEIIRTLGSLREPAAFVLWMKQLAYHQCTRYFKKRTDILADEDSEGRSVFDTIEETRTEFIPDRALDQQDFRRTLMGMIDALPQEQSASIMLFYYDDLPIRDIANIQRVSESTVKSRLTYARRALRRSVESYEARSGVRLHSFGLAPIMVWLFRDYFRQAVPVISAELIADGVATATGVGIALPTSGATVAATGVTAAPVVAAPIAAPAAAAATGVAIKGGSAVAGKVIAGLLAASLVVGVPTALYLRSRQPRGLPRPVPTSEPTAPPITTTLPAETSLPEGAFVNYETDGRWENRNISVLPMEVYYEDGKLVARCYIFNGFSADVEGVTVTDITVTDAQGRTIASGAFGSQNLSIEAKGYIVHRFTFLASDVVRTDGDLSSLGFSYGCDYRRAPAPDANEYVNYDINGRRTTDAISVIPTEVYYEDGLLVARCYVFNGYSTTATNVDISRIILTGKDNVTIADGNFSSTDFTIAPQSYIVHTFVFSGDALITSDADLSYIRYNAHWDCDH